MGNHPGSILTDSCGRDWFVDGDTPPDPGQTRSRIYDRLQATIESDAVLLADALIGEREGDTWLDPGEVAEDIDPRELDVGIQDLVAALYAIGDKKGGLDVERSIRGGIKKGKKGRLAALKDRMENDPHSLTLGELTELRKIHLPESDLDAEGARHANRLIDQNMDNVDSLFGVPDELAEAIESDADE